MSLKKNASIQKVYFKYTSNFQCKFVSLESLLMYTSSILLTQKRNTNSCQKQIESILEVYFITKFLMDSKYTWNIEI